MSALTSTVTVPEITYDPVNHTRVMAVNGHVLEFWQDEHAYTLDSRPIDGVTTIIGSVVRMRQLEVWRERVGTEEANRIRDEAGTHGALLHAAAAVAGLELEDIPFDLEPEFEASYNAFTQWFETNVDEVIATELPIFNVPWWYAGRLDLVARLKGRKLPCLVDYKTGSGVWPSTRLQTAAYRKGAHEILGVPIGDRVVVHLPRTDPGRCNPIRYREHQQDWLAWTNVLALHRWMKGVK